MLKQSDSSQMEDSKIFSSDMPSNAGSNGELTYSNDSQNAEMPCKVKVAKIILDQMHIFCHL